MTLISKASLLGLMLGLAACNAMSSDAGSFVEDPDGYSTGDGVSTGDEGTTGGSTGTGAGSDGISDGPGAPMPGEDGSEGNGSGLLTAGVWDDNLNFDFFKGYLDTTGSIAGKPFFALSDREAAQQKWGGERSGASELDITFVLDTTGSMGDELSYIRDEIGGIADRLKVKFPATTPRYGLVVYKDQGDSYVTRSYDFTTLAKFRENLGPESASGGGDYPEAVAEGLADAMKLSWRTGAVARMAFWVADAPHHDNAAQSVQTSILEAVDKDVHIYPVAASGVDDLAEYTMRSAAQLTGGRYVFLTDDSGIGNSHAEPHIPCYYVTRFDSAIVRMVESELTGKHVEATKEEIIRTVGNPVNGRCPTEDAGELVAF